MNINEMLKEIEQEIQGNPNIIWTFLNENDLLLTKTGNNKYIVCVDRYLAPQNLIVIKFIYSLGSDTFYSDNGFDSPDNVDGYPNSSEIAQLYMNIDFLMYLDENT